MEFEYKLILKFCSQFIKTFGGLNRKSIGFGAGKELHPQG
jgi:hypothetical protein